MDEAVRAMRRRLFAALGPTRAPMSGRSSVPSLPVGRLVTLPGRGEVFVRDHRPAGAIDPPVLLLHGWSWSLDVNYFGVMPGLVADRVGFVGYDQRGHGRGLPADRPFEIEDLAADALALLDLLGVGKVLVCGYSLGGPVGLHLALARPDRVAGLVLAATALNYRQTLRDRTVWRVLTAATPLARLGIGSSISARYFGLSRRTSPELAAMWPWLLSELARTSVSGVFATGRAVSRYDLRHRVAGLRRIPAAVVITTHDTVCHPGTQRQLAGQLEARSFALPADHDAPVVRPAEFTAALLAGIAHVRSLSSK
ncbi:alpha/beta fold hydrolase [Amycolatopsis sp. NPDC051758]|uniref:alpha/beta fold hydrolase n=1 Tax=Amycolatopsis sp. NPDC051758 TaxID=3363935 RepID=UPI0037B642D1